jgi:RNA polymerase sigma-70 factor (ECF subfamily)
MGRMSDERADQELITAIAKGDTGCFETLYRRHRDFVWRTALRIIGGDEHAAMDVSQEVFAWLLQRCRTRLTLTAKLSTFLYPAIRNIALTRVRRTSREVLGEVPDRPAPAEPQVSDTLEVLLATLPEAQREVLLLRFVEDMSLLEIAAALEIPTGTVKSRLHHALEAIRRSPRICDLL